MTERASRPYVVVGGGAIGGTLAFYLAQAGHRVSVVESDAGHRAAIANDGLVIERGDESQRQRVAAVMAPEEAPAGMQRVLLAVKANGTPGAAAWLEDHLAEDGYVVSMQNGLNEAVLVEHLGAARVVGAFVDLFADVVRPGTIRDGGVGALAVGELDGTISERVNEIVYDLQAWGGAVATDNVLGYLWSKLGFGGCLRPQPWPTMPWGNSSTAIGRDCMPLLAKSLRWRASWVLVSRVSMPSTRWPTCRVPPSRTLTKLLTGSSAGCERRPRTARGCGAISPSGTGRRRSLRTTHPCSPSQTSTVWPCPY